METVFLWPLQGSVEGHFLSKDWFICSFWDLRMKAKFVVNFEGGH